MTEPQHPERLSNEQLIKELDRQKEALPEETDIWICWHYPLQTPPQFKPNDPNIPNVTLHTWMRGVLCLHDWDNKRIFYTEEEPFRVGNPFKELKHETLLETKSEPNGKIDPDLKQWIKNRLTNRNITYTQVANELQTILDEYQAIGNKNRHYLGIPPINDGQGWIRATTFEQPTPP